MVGKADLDMAARAAHAEMRERLHTETSRRIWHLPLLLEPPITLLGHVKAKLDY
jgi:hypothetical protein